MRWKKYHYLNSLNLVQLVQQHKRSLLPTVGISFFWPPLLPGLRHPNCPTNPTLGYLRASPIVLFHDWYSCSHSVFFSQMFISPSLPPPPPPLPNKWWKYHCKQLHPRIQVVQSDAYLWQVTNGFNSIVSLRLPAFWEDVILIFQLHSFHFKLCVQWLHPIWLFNNFVIFIPIGWPLMPSSPGDIKPVHLSPPPVTSVHSINPKSNVQCKCNCMEHFFPSPLFLFTAFLWMHRLYAYSSLVGRIQVHPNLINFNLIDYTFLLISISILTISFLSSHCQLMDCIHPTLLITIN